MMFMDQTLEEFIKNVNSKELPGGGSISALTALLGVGILSLIHISEPTRPCGTSRMPSSA